MRILVSKEAEDDIQNSIDWYKEQKLELGNNFFLNIIEAFKIIAEGPYLFPKVYKQTRKKLIKSFPYAVYYLVENKEIKVIAILHFKRNIDKLYKRLEN